MLGQIIFTRSFPHRDLLNQGAVEQNEGFGVFSLSQNVLDLSLQERQVLQNRLSMHNAGTEMDIQKPFISYEYLLLKDGVSALFRTTVKPREVDSSNRGGNYVKQCIVGNTERSPLDWIGSKCWDAHLPSENDYYLKDGSDPPLLNPIVDQVPLSRKSPEWKQYCDQLRQFIADGRQEAIKIVMWFILQQLSLPETERKVLLICDTPENVEKWVGAVSIGLSPKMRTQLSFSTNLTRLSGNAAVELFYYTDGAGNLYRTPNSGLMRIPYCIMVGYLPNDPFCSVQKIGECGFEILDTTTFRFTFVPDDQAICSPFFDALTDLNPDLEEYCELLLPELGENIMVSKLPELYDTCLYLFYTSPKSEKWNRSEIIRNIDNLLCNAPQCSKRLRDYIITHGIACYDRMAQDDENDQLRLMNQYWNLAKNTKKRYDLVEYCINRFQELLDVRCLDIDRLYQYWETFEKYTDPDLKKLVLDAIFDETELIRYTKQVKYVDGNTAAVIFTMFISMLREEGTDLDTLVRGTNRYNFIRELLAWQIQDEERLISCMNEISNNEHLMSSLVTDVATTITKETPMLIKNWWDIVLQASGLDIRAVCKQMSCVQSIDEIEELLTNEMLRRNGCSQEIMDALLRYSGELKPDTGMELIGQWINIANTDSYTVILKLLCNSRLGTGVQKELFRRIDEKLLEREEVSMKCLQELNNCAIVLNLHSKRVQLHNAVYELKKHPSNGEVFNAVTTIRKAAIDCPPHFTSWKLWSYFCGHVIETNDEEIYLYVWMMFHFKTESAQEKLICSFLEQALAVCHNKNELAARMLIIYKAILYCQGTTAKKAQSVADKQFRTIVSKYYKIGTYNVIEKTTSKELLPAKNKLLGILDNIRPKIEKSSLFGGLFGKNDKNKQ